MKTLKNTLLIILILSMMITAVACKPSIDNGDSSDSDIAADGTEETEKNGNGSGNSSTDAPSLEHIEGNGEETKNDFSRYSIIASKSNVRASNAASALSVKLTSKGFSLPMNESSVYEIIIGDSDAEETKSALSQLAKSSKDYIIQFNGTKIIIAAKTDLALSEACTAFYDTYIKDMTSKTLSVKDGTTTLGIAEALATLVYDGKAQYEIVYGNVKSSVKDKGNELISFIKSTCGVSSVTIGSSYNASKNQILIGTAGFIETTKALKNIKANEYTVSKIGNKIVVAGKSDDNTILAIEAFKKVIEDAKSANTKKGSYTISMPNAVVDGHCASLDDIPRFTGATYSTTYPSGTGIKQLYYTSANASKISEYVATLESLGYKKTEDNSLNGNRFVTCYGANGLIHISYLNHNKTLSVILDSLQGSVYKDTEPTYTKVTDTTLAVMSLNYDSGDNDASGMSYVVTLEDGRYVVFDGGYRIKNSSKKDANILYNYMKSNNKRKDGKIVIAAWIFTHDHSDHHGAFTDFAIDYSSKTELQYYVQNFGDKSRYNQQPSGWLNTGIPGDLIANYYKNAKKIVPHTGQKLTFCNTTFEIMSSQESHVPNKMEWVNDASLIIRMNANGVKALFLADAEAQTTKLLLNMYGSTLKSDIMQIAHHGYSGGSVDLYKKIDPDWSLWPTNQASFNQRAPGGGNGNAQTQNKWAYNNTTCYVADGNIEMLKFVGGTSKISVTTCAPNPNKQ